MKGDNYESWKKQNYVHSFTGAIFREEMWIISLPLS